jgi:hypothetical protein
MSGSGEIVLRAVRVSPCPNGRFALSRIVDGAFVVPPRPAEELLRFLLEHTDMPDYATLARESCGQLEGLGMLCPEPAMSAVKRICGAARDEKNAQNTAVAGLSDIRITLGRGGMEVTAFDDATTACGFDAAAYDSALKTAKEHDNDFVALETAAGHINEIDREVPTNMGTARAAFKYAKLSFTDYFDAKRACGKARGATAARTRAIALKGQLERICRALRQARDPKSAA